MAKANEPDKPKEQKSVAFTDNSTRTLYLNKLASSINKIIGPLSNHQKHGDFYSNLLKRFRTQPDNNRLLLLYTLKGVNIHERYTLDRLQGRHDISVKPLKASIKVTIDVKNHPRKFPKTNCYCYEAILITWNKNTDEPVFDRRGTEWIDPHKSENIYDLFFKKDADVVHWLLCLKQQMGRDGEAFSLKLQGMAFIDMGSLDEKDNALLKKYLAEEKKKRSTQKKEVDEIIRVKARKKKN